ncbi:MAG: PEGA domain-containing protein [bacterium]|nr:PEGA domain-containing protein [bacterium]
MKESHEPNRNHRPDKDKKAEQASTPDPSPKNEPAGDDDLDFVVTEAHTQEHELVGGVDTPKTPAEDDLGIQSAADFMEDSARIDDEASDTGPIGESHVAAPPPPDYSYQAPRPNRSDAIQVSDDNLSTPDKPDRIEKLSEEQVREISQKMKQPEKRSEYLSEDEKFDLIKNLDNIDDSSTPTKGFDNSPIVPPKKSAREASEAPAPTADLPEVKPHMAQRVRGVAYFTKSFIQITGEQELHEDDELTVNGRDYLLKHKKVSNKVLFGALGPLAAVLIFWVAAMFVSDANTGEGRVIGVVLDENQQPVLLGASVRFPDIGKEYQANAQGFFKTDPMESGSMKVEFLFDNEIVGQDYATVVDGQITTIALIPNLYESEPPPQAAKPQQPTEIAQAPKPEQSKSSTPAKASRKKKSSSGKKSSAPKWAKLALEANVENAKLSVDGSVLGAGNLTYSKLKPGEHSYAVSKEGFEPAEGTFTLKAGKTESLKISLTPATAAAKRAVYDEQDFLRSARNNIQLGNYQVALDDLEQAIAKSPSFVDAYTERAAVYSGQGQMQAAHDDYIRAAEILRFKNSYNEAVSAYNKAIGLDKKSIGGYLGRASLYLAQGQDIAAITDFDMVIRLDKRNLQGHLGLGEARYNQGSFKKAVKHFKDARSLTPKDPAIHQSLMLAYLGEGNIKQVNKSYDKYLKYASEEEAQKMKSDPEFSAVMRVIKD